MPEEKTTLKKELFKDRDEYMQRLIDNVESLSNDEKLLYNEFLSKLNKYIDICEKRGKRY